MGSGVFSLVPEERMKEILSNLQAFTGLAIQLIDSDGQLLMSFGHTTNYCAILKKHVFNRDECFTLHKKSGIYAQELGEAYIFSCHANLNHIAFPLILDRKLLGSVIIGPFLMDHPDSTLISDLAERQNLSPGMVLELYDELKDIAILPPAKVNQLKKITEQLLAPLLPGERALLLQNQQKMLQQARINETIQVYKEENYTDSLVFFYNKEKELLEKTRIGNIQDVKSILNEIIGHVLFSEGGRVDAVRIRAIELTTLLSRVAIEGGANPDSVFHLNSQFLFRLYEEQELEELCLQLQEVLESFVSCMFQGKDKGNPYIRNALQYMSNNYNQHIDLKVVADHVGLSPSYFSTLFRKTVGISFREHLNWIRVEESKSLLLGKKYTLAEIALSMGFPDQSYYCKVFKKYVGVTPGQYQYEL